MKSASPFVAVGLSIVLSACATPGPAGKASSSQSPDAVQWKEVTRNVAGNVVTYRVPASQKVPDDINLRPFETGQQVAQAAPSNGDAASARVRQKSAEAAPARGGDAPAAPGQQKSPEGLIVAPVFRTPPQPPVENRVAADAASMGASASISQDALTALGHAEIAVRGAQTRFETAQEALKRARDAARNGDSAAAMKFAKTATSLAQPAQ